MCVSLCCLVCLSLSLSLSLYTPLILESKLPEIILSSSYWQQHTWLAWPVKVMTREYWPWFQFRSTCVRWAYTSCQLRRRRFRLFFALTSRMSTKFAGNGNKWYKASFFFAQQFRNAPALSLLWTSGRLSTDSLRDFSTGFRRVPIDSILYSRVRRTIARSQSEMIRCEHWVQEAAQRSSCCAQQSSGFLRVRPVSNHRVSRTKTLLSCVESREKERERRERDKQHTYRQTR